MCSCQNHGHVVPIIRILYLKPLNFSIPCYIATNSVTNTEDSIVGCSFLDSQWIATLLQKMIKTVLECQVCLSQGGSLSTIIHMSMPLPKGAGMLVGIGLVISL